MARVVSELKGKLESAQDTLTELRKMSNVPWAKADELAAKLERFDEITKQLKAEAHATPEQAEVNQDQAQVVAPQALARTY